MSYDDDDLAQKAKSQPPQQSRYMSQNKKKYYLASVDENVEMLRKEQINDLTKVLIGLKSEYDNLVRESTNKKRETEMICKKADLLEQMDEKVKKKSEEQAEVNSTMTEAIKVKVDKWTEERYTKKTLLKQIEKLKTDIFLNTKEVSNSEEYQEKWKYKYQKEKLFETDIKEKHNKIYSKILQQKHKNSFDKNEYELQLQYYQTIIEQKWMFIKTADERKERQRKIALEAKNDSHDKQEIDLRINWELLYFYDKYLKVKMASKLEESVEIEKTFQKIRDICGTSNLKIMVDKIINKDKRYNYSAARVQEKENTKKIWNAEIKLLEKNFESCKSGIVVNEDSVNQKDIQVIKTIDVENNNDKLIEQEAELTNQFRINQEIYKEILLKHEQVKQNLLKMCGWSKNWLSQANTSDININVNNINANSQSGDVSQDMSTNIKNSDLNIDINEDNWISAYIEHLKSAEKTIEMLFLCHSKQEFLNMIREKGIEENEMRRTKNKMLEMKEKMDSTSKNNTTTRVRSNRVDSELDYSNGNTDDKWSAEDKVLQDQIFNTFMMNARKEKHPNKPNKN